MGPPCLCFSTAPILRCELLSIVQYGVLIVPPGLELIVSIMLVIAFWGSGWKHFFLAAEAWIYFALALLDSLSHLIPAVRESVAISSNIDIVVASLSFLPILLYMVFLYLLMRANFIVVLPKKLQNFAHMFLIIFIPLIVAVNEIASFIGISRRPVQIGWTTVLNLGFISETNQLLWTFFTSFTLAILTIFQAFNFFLAFYRVVSAIVNQRNIEISAIDAVHFMKGTGWIAGGLKLGAIETVIGFAQGGFGGAIIRRILRLLSRTCLVLGMIKGIDTVEDFQWLERGKRRLIRKSRRRANRRESGLGFPRLRRGSRLPDETSIVSPTILTPNNKDRVTVHFEKGRAPTLLLRLSFLDLPTPSAVEAAFKSRQSLEGLNFDHSAFPGPSGSKANQKRATVSFGDLLAPRGHVTSSHSLVGNDTNLTPDPRFLSVPQQAKMQDTRLSLPPDQDTTPFSLGYPTSVALAPGSPAIALPSPTAMTSVKRVSALMTIQVPSSPTILFGKPRTRHPGYGHSFISLTRSNTEVTSPPTSPTRTFRSTVATTIPRRSSVHDGRLSSSSSAYSYSSHDLWSSECFQNHQAHRKSDFEEPYQHFHSDPDPLAPDDNAPATSTAPSAHEQQESGYPLPPSPHTDPVDNQALVRIKSIGKAPRRTTPVPTRVHRTIPSISVDPILPTQTVTTDETFQGEDGGHLRYGSLAFPSQP